MARLKAGADIRVEVEGLRELRRDLRAMDAALPKEVSGVLRQAAQIVADEARRRAPVRSGTLAAGYRPGTAGDKALVRTTVPYAPVHEFGGTIRPRGTPITIRKQSMIYGAIARRREDVERLLLREFDQLASRHGWR